MLHSKFSVKNDVSGMRADLYANTEFGYSIHEFDVRITDNNYELVITDKEKFKLLAMVLRTSQKNLKEYIIDNFKEDHQWQTA